MILDEEGPSWGRRNLPSLYARSTVVSLNFSDNDDDDDDDEDESEAKQ